MVILSFLRKLGLSKIKMSSMNIDVKKIALLRNVVSVLSERELTDVNLLMHEMDLQPVNSDEWESSRGTGYSNTRRASALLNRIENLSRNAVEKLASAVNELFGTTVDEHKESEPTSLSLFASYADAQKDFVSQVSNELGEWGISLFVAHQSIEPGKEWPNEIEQALNTCDAGLIFLQNGFEDSEWCNQEVGWLLGRGIPCYTLKFQENNPQGLLGLKQAFTIKPGTTAPKIGNRIIKWLSTKTEVSANFYDSMTKALLNSPRYHQTDCVLEQLASAHDLDDQEVASLLTAVRDNDQVYNASTSYPKQIFELAKQQPGFETNLELAKEVAKIRKIEYLLPEDSEPEGNENGNATIS